MIVPPPAAIVTLSLPPPRSMVPLPALVTVSAKAEPMTVSKPEMVSVPSPPVTAPVARLMVTPPVAAL